MAIFTGVIMAVLPGLQYRSVPYLCLVYYVYKNTRSKVLCSNSLTVYILNFATISLCVVSAPGDGI